MSLKQIAEMTGVSCSTVSRVLNNTSPSCASKEVRDKIFAAARKIGYLPNENARNLRSLNKTNEENFHVSIVLARIASLDDDPFFHELFQYLETSLYDQRVITDQVIYAEESISKDIPSSGGVVILGRCSDKLLDQIFSHTKNVVGIWRNSVDFKVDEVICDGRKAADRAMEHLISLGHKNIAYIGDCSYESRYVGYCNALIRHNIPMNYDWIKHTNQSKSQGRGAFLELLNNENDFSAVFCANDVTAISVLEVLKEKKKEIKRPISVISIDNIAQSESTTPFLTTIDIPKEEMAHMAVTLLLDRMRKKHSETVRLEFPCRVINRSSCFKYE